VPANRLFEVYNRLASEGYQGIKVPEAFMPLLKTLNILKVLSNNDDLQTSDIEKIVDDFNQLDKGYIYRKHSSEDLGGLLLLLKELTKFTKGEVYE
jgi:predicted nucleic-acid-binding protein